MYRENVTCGGRGRKRRRRFDVTMPAIKAARQFAKSPTPAPRPAPQEIDPLTAPRRLQKFRNSSNYCRSDLRSDGTDGKLGGFGDQRQTPILIRFGDGRARREEGASRGAKLAVLSSEKRASCSKIAKSAPRLEHVNNSRHDGARRDGVFLALLIEKPYSPSPRIENLSNAGHRHTPRMRSSPVFHAGELRLARMKLVHPRKRARYVLLELN